MTVFQFLKLHGDFHVSGLIYTPTSSVYVFPVPQHPHKNLLLFVFFEIIIFMRVGYNFHVVLILIFLMTEDVGHFLLYLLATCVPSFEQCLLNLRSSLYILNVNPVRCMTRAIAYRWAKGKKKL